MYYPQQIFQPQFGNRIFEQQPQGFFLKGRPVSSIEEAKASPIDFDGSIFYFPDVANGKIYTKQIGADGTSTIIMYEQKELPEETPISAVEFVTKEELQESLEEVKKLIAQSKIVNNF
jgi:hypothetical protein